MVRSCLGLCLALTFVTAAVSAQSNQAKFDLSGVWRLGIPPGYVLNIAADLGTEEIRPAATELFVKRASEFGATDPATSRCLPFGPRHIIGGGMVGRVRIVQSPERIAFLYEDLTYRDVPVGQPPPAILAPSYMGHASAEWQGDVLVIRTVGFTNHTWLDYTGHPNSEALQITERYRWLGPDRLAREIEIVDPENFTRPITIPTDLTRITDQPPMLEYVCGENNKAGALAKVPTRRPPVVPVALLDRYVGSYRAGTGGGAFTVAIRLAGNRLVADVDGKGGVPLTPLSATSFSGSILGTYTFQASASGVVSGLRIYSVGTDGVMEAHRVIDAPADGRAAQ